MSYNPRHPKANVQTQLYVIWENNDRIDVKQVIVASINLSFVVSQLMRFVPHLILR